MSNDALPSIEEVAAKFNETPEPAPAAPAPQEPEMQPEPQPEPAVDVDQAPEPTPEPPVETSAREPVPEPPANDYMRLSAEEIEYLERERAFRDRETSFSDREKQIAEKEEKLANMTKNPAKMLRELGISQEDIINSQLGDNPEAEEPTIEDKLAKLEQAQKARLDELENQIQWYKDKAQQEEDQKAYEKVMDMIGEFVDSQSNKFELVKAFKEQGRQMVNQVMVSHYEKYQKPLDMEIACGMVEQYYEEHFVTPIVGTDKVKSRFAAPKPPPKPAPVAEKKTLTSTDTPSSNVKPDLDNMSKSEALDYLTTKYLTMMNQK